MSWPECIVEPAVVARMHAAAVEILARTGMRIEHEEIGQAIARRGGFKASGGRVLIGPEKVAAWKAASDRDAAGPAPLRPAGEPVRCAIGDRPRFIVDRDGRSVRNMTRSDVIDGAKFIAALARQRGVLGTTWGVPTDCPPAMQPIEQFMITARYSPAGGRTDQDGDLATTAFVREMNGVYGRRHGQGVFCLNPLILGGPSVEAFWHFRDDLASASVGTMPLMGITAPCDPIAVFVLAMAECVGAAAILHELVPAVPVRVSPHPVPADMRSAAITYGTPEWELLDLMHRDVHAFYGQPYDDKRLRTTSPVPDALAVIDHTRSALLGTLGGYRYLSGVGQLSLDEVFSPAMAIFDLEAAGQAERIARGAESGEGLELDALPGVIDRVVREGILFAEHETTVRNLRRQHYAPPALRRLSRGQWLAAGSPDRLAEAHAEVDRLIGLYEYEPPREVLRELEGIYRRARAALAGGLAGT